MSKYDDTTPITNYFTCSPTQLVDFLFTASSGNYPDIYNALRAWDVIIDGRVFSGRVTNLTYTPSYTASLSVGWNLLAYFDIDTRYDIVAHCVALSFNPMKTSAYIAEKFLELNKDVDPPEDVRLFSIR